MRSDLRLCVCFSCLRRLRSPTRSGRARNFVVTGFRWHTNIACATKAHQSGGWVNARLSMAAAIGGRLLDFSDRPILLPEAVEEGNLVKVRLEKSKCGGPAPRYPVDPTPLP